MLSVIDTAEDLRWLQDVHGVPTEGFVLAVLHGNEDCPVRVDLYAQDDYRCEPRVWIAGDDGILVERQPKGDA